MISLSPPTICNSALLPKVVAMRAEGRSYRWIARELGISKNTVADIVQRHRANA
ncbi:MULTISPECIES: helix-turn-helix domain-containing protein [Enterobacteriaceae]|nr:helix-turn-helix domain-containing protein [Escherichia coli]MDV1762919.1 helix-turn-helix domain-containing protein [Escherichia coli]HDX2843010.1 helix-turn-helix domain-containing protein [Escherichia coli]